MNSAVSSGLVFCFFNFFRNEQIIDGKMRTQQVMDELLVPPSKQSVESSVIVLKSGSKEVDTKIMPFFYENGISFSKADSSSFACMIEESMKYAKQNSVTKLESPFPKTVIRRSPLPSIQVNRATCGPYSEAILANAKQSGAAISSNGWSDVQRRQILNFMESTRAAAFLKSINCTNHRLQCCEDAT